MPVAPIDATTPKEEAIERLAAALGIQDVNPWGGHYAALFAAARAAGLPSNPDLVFRPWHEIAGAVWHAGPVAEARWLAGADRLGKKRMLGNVEYSGGREHAPRLDMVELPNATVLALDGVPVIVAADGVSVVETVSSDYAPLLHVFDFGARERLAGARRVAGTAFVLMGDIGDGNYSHWLLDELPRLALLRDRADVFIVIADIAVPSRRELLDLLGIAESRIIALRRNEALRADTLLVPDIARNTQHPARLGAAWVIDWLRGRIGLPASARHRASNLATAHATKLYIGRADADRRRLQNEAELLRVLEPAGFVSITPGRLSVVEQIALFSRADAIVALHGAALTNIIFCAPGTAVLEIFGPTYGTPAFGLLAAACGLPYASYVAEPASIPPDRAQDCLLDVAAFWRDAGPWLRGRRT